MIELRMRCCQIIWDPEDDQRGNVEHIAEHGLSVEDVEAVLESPSHQGRSHSTGLPVFWGYTPDVRYIIVVVQEVADGVIRVVTAYEVDEPRS